MGLLLTVSPSVNLNIFFSKDLYIVDGSDWELSLMEVQQITGTFLQVASICDPGPAWEKVMNMLESKECMRVGVLESQNCPRMIPSVDVPSYTLSMSGQETEKLVTINSTTKPISTLMSQSHCPSLPRVMLPPSPLLYPPHPPLAVPSQP